MKNILASLAIVAFACSFAAAQEKVDNPAYKYWSSFKAGAMSKTKTVSEVTTPNGPMKSVMEITTTLKEITDDKAVLNISSVVEANGQKMPATSSDVDILAKVDAKPKDGKEDPNVIYPDDIKEVGTEEIEVAGKKYACKVFEFAKESNGMKIVTKSWTNAEVPGGVVKAEVTMTGSMNSKSTTILVECKAEKK